MKPQRPAMGTDNGRLLDAMLQAYPNAYWNPNSRLKLMAHSRAADLRKLGWDVQAVSRRGTSTGARREHGYVLRTMPDGIAETRRAGQVRAGGVSFADEVVPAATAAERCGLTLDQLRYLDRMGTVPFDLVNGGHGKYLASTVRLLQAAGTLVGLGIGLDTALVLLRSHADDVAAALRLVAFEGVA